MCRNKKLIHFNKCTLNNWSNLCWQLCWKTSTSQFNMEDDVQTTNVSPGALSTQSYGAKSHLKKIDIKYGRTSKNTGVEIIQWINNRLFTLVLPSWFSNFVNQNLRTHPCYFSFTPILPKWLSDLQELSFYPPSSF